MLYARAGQKKSSKTKLNVSIQAIFLVLPDLNAQVQQGKGDAVGLLV